MRFEGIVTGGFCWEELTLRRWQDPKSLERYGYKVYSQNDEDGIIQEIFRRIGTTDRRFIEFGVQNGLESNCHYLLHKGWSGLWIEGSSEYVREIHGRFRPVIQSGQLHVRNAFITRDNINGIFTEENFTGDLDLLSVDIDGNDYYVWQAVEAVRPRVVVIEYNGKFPPDTEWKQAYNSTHVWDGSDWQGASPKSYELLGREKGYQLVGTNFNGVNAFFVREDLPGDKFITPATAETLYNLLRPKLTFTANHKPRYCLVGQHEESGLKDYGHIREAHKSLKSRIRRAIFKLGNAWRNG